MSVSHLHAQDVNPLERPFRFLGAEKDVYQRIERRITDVIARAIYVDVQIGAMPGHEIAEHPKQECRREIPTCRHICQRAKHYQ